MSGSSSSSKRDWRRTPRGDTPTRGKGLKRALLTTCLLAITGLFVYLIWFVVPSYPTLHWAVLPIGQYEIRIRPVPRFAGIAAAVPSARVHLLPKMDEAREIREGLGRRLREIVPKQASRDILVICVSAHGVSQRGKAYLLAKDFNPNPARMEGRLELADLLGQIRQCPARLKLLVLDTAHLATDPRLGMVVNEFPRLLAEEVKNLDDPSLWVLASARPLENSHFCYAVGQSIFSYYTIQAVSGAADQRGNSDRSIDLDEFFYFVRDGVADWVRKQTGGRETQTPWLLRGGMGVVQSPPEGIVLLEAPARKKRGEEDVEGEGEEDVEGKDEALQHKKDPPASEHPDSTARDAPDSGEADPTPHEQVPPTDKPSPHSGQSPAAATDGEPGVAQTARKAAGAEPAADAEPAAAAAPVGKVASDSQQDDLTENPPEKPAEKRPRDEARHEAPDKARDEARLAEVRYREARNLLEDAWKWRDSLQSRGGPEEWSPVDYAPHLWRKYQQRLLGLEWRLRYGLPLDDANLRELQALSEAGSPASHEGQAGILGRLADARKRFLAGPIKIGFDDHPQQRDHVARAVQLKNDLFFALPYYLRWHAWASRSASIDRRIAETINQTIEELAVLADDLESLAPGEPSAGDGGSPPTGPSSLQTLRHSVDTLQTLRDKLWRTEAFQREVRDLTNQPGEEAVAKIETLLSTPLLAAELRMKLLDTLQSIRQRPPDLPDNFRPAEELSAEDRKARWTVLERHARLERAVIVELADPYSPAATQWAAVPRANQSSDELWSQYRTLGTELAEFYTGLPERINGRIGAGDPQTIHQLGRLLPMADPRDVLEEGAGLFAVGPIDWPALEGVRVEVVAGDPRVKLTLGEPSDLELTIGISASPATAVSLKLDFNRSQVQVEDSAQKLALDQNRWEKLTFGPDGKTTLHLRISPRRKLDRFAPLTVSVKADGRTAAPLDIPLEMKLPEVVDLVVERILDAEGNRVECERIEEDEASIVRCPAFPNRLTEYAFSLRNRSGKGRTVTVEFLPDQPPPKAGQERRKLFDRDGRLLAAFTPLATAPIQVTLPPGENLVPIKLLPRQAEEEGKENGQPKDARSVATEPKQAEDTAAKQLLTRGMACVIRDQEGEILPTQWIDFSNVSPTAYLEPFVRYRHSRRKVTIELRPVPDANLLPAFLADNPIPVEWDTSVLPLGTPMVSAAEIAAPDGVASLWADVDPQQTPEIEIRLTVDGYPRAFVFQPFPTNQDWNRVDVNDNLMAIKITAPNPHTAYMVTDTGVQRTVDDQTEEGITLGLQVDVPTDFGRTEGVIEAGIDRNGDHQLDRYEKQQFYADRQVEIRLEELTPQGTLKIFSKVGDYQISLEPGGLANKAVSLLAQIVQNGNTRDDDEIQVVLDAAQPVFFVETSGAAVPPGSMLPVEVEVQPKDLSGVKKMEFGFDLNNSKDLEEDEVLKTLQTVGLDGKWTTELPTEGLEPGQAYSLLVRATDRVEFVSKRTRTIRIALATDAMPEDDKPKTVTVIGRAYRGNPTRKSQWTSLHIDGMPGIPQIDLSSGDFTFQKVPPGSYTLNAKGTLGGRYRKGTLDVEVRGNEKTVTANIPIE